MMKISKFIKNLKRNSFILDISNKQLKLIDILEKINSNKLGFLILKEDSKNFKIVTDGDIRRFLCKKKNLNLVVNNKPIGNKKIVKVDINKSLYDLSRVFIRNQINTVILTRNSKIISYILKDEILEYLSPERLVVDNAKIKKYSIDLDKHFLRYNFANFFSNKKYDVLDAACGVGYGSYLISKNCKSIIGVDFSKSAIQYAKNYYKRKNIKFINMDILNLKENKKFDLIVSLETLEHLNKNEAINWLKKCKRLLKTNGVILCSSPLLRIRKGKPYITNPHHLHEMRKKEFLGHLKKIFSPKILFTFIQDGSNFKALTNEQSGLCFAYVQI